MVNEDVLTSGVLVQIISTGGDDDGLVSANGVLLGFTLVPAGLSQFYKDSLNPVQ